MTTRAYKSMQVVPSQCFEFPDGVDFWPVKYQPVILCGPDGRWDQDQWVHIHVESFDICNYALWPDRPVRFDAGDETIIATHVELPGVCGRVMDWPDDDYSIDVAFFETVTVEPGDTLTLIWHGPMVTTL